MLRSIDIPAAFVFPVLLLLLQIAVTSVWGTLPFGNRNGDSGAAGGFVGGVGGGRRNNPRLPVSPEAYMSSVSYSTFIIPGSYIPTVKVEVRSYLVRWKNKFDLKRRKNERESVWGL
jgi:hypothetical protein